MSKQASSRARTVAVLAYHKIGAPPAGGWDTWFYTPVKVFASQLQYLRENGWQVIGIPALLQGLEAPESLPERAALLTFDDGYRSYRTTALPELLRFGFPAVMFVPAGLIGGVNAFDAGNEPEEPICDWDDLRDLEALGTSIQSHGFSHRHFSRLSPEEQESELVTSREILEAGLGKRVEVFSFPYGDEGGSVGAILARSGYRAACLYGGGVIRLPGAERYRLTRIAMGSDTDLASILTHGRSGFEHLTPADDLS